MTSPEDILAFWFPAGLDADEDTHRRQFEWWFRGGADRAIVERFQPVLGAACRGELYDWADLPRGRLALIIVLDQFSRTVYRDTAQAFAQDDKALNLAMDGLERGQYAQLATVWEKTFFVLPPRPLGADRATRTLRFALRSAGRRGARGSAEGLRVFGIPGARPSRRHRPLRSPSPSQRRAWSEVDRG
jgi:hypothetical protein